MDVEALSYELEEIIQENIERGSMFSIAKVTAIWEQTHPDIDCALPAPRRVRPRRRHCATRP